ncbi:MAG TPA: RNA methyltransferase [Chthonomonadaceae bacterium]|nr:RNA methyltransferase [Chthonomonadaceae bacterium]
MALDNMQTEQEGGVYQDRLVYSRNDPAVRRIRDLQTREGRERTGLFLIEGIKPLAEAVVEGARVETLVVAPAVLTNTLGHKLVKRLRIGGTPCLRLSPEVYHSVSQAEEPQGIAAVLRQRWERLDQVRPSRGLCWIAAEAVQSAGNLGTILRTSEAVGGSGVILIGDTVDPFNPATVRASMGSLFHQKIVRTTVEAFAAWKRRHQCLLVGTSASAETDYKALRYPSSLILLMGGEKRGVSPEVAAMCDAMVRIPMVGRTNSLNIAIAAGVLLYEVFDQRRGCEPDQSLR